MSAGRVTRRPERADDESFRFDLFCQSLPPGADFAGLDAPLRGMLLRQQFAGQTTTYRAAYPDARFEIVEHDDASVGRVVVDTGPDAITLVDIALLPEWRGRGIGAGLIGDMLAVADRPVRLAVRHGSRARALYERLGFETVATDEIETRM